MLKLKTIDLCSGIGGTALGLRRFLKVVAYCEKDEDCATVLKTNMRRGRLDNAPIVRDVANFPRDLEAVDCVVSSFPCQSVSALGQREGFAGKSGLFLEIMQIIRHYKPAICFFENVDNIRHMTNEWRYVLAALHKAGYDSKWAMISACHVGAPHRRKRWFLLANLRTATYRCSGVPVCLKPASNRPWNHHTYEFRKNSAEPNLPRMVKIGNERIMRMCGNICVPLQAHLAFSLLRHDGFFTEITEVKTPLNSMPASGMFVGGRLYEGTHVALPEQKDYKLEFQQYYYNVAPKKRNVRQRNPILAGGSKRKHFASPRVCSASWTPSSILTKRSIEDLATQIRFERGTKARERQFRKINPEWVTWLVGIPKDYLVP